MTDKEVAIENLLFWAETNASMHQVVAKLNGDILTLDYIVGDMKMHGITCIEERNGKYIDGFVLTTEKTIDGRRCAIRQMLVSSAFCTAPTTLKTLHDAHIAAKKIFQDTQTRISEGKITPGTTKP